LLFLPTIYPITDSRISGLSQPEQVKRLIAGGARFIQLREKYASPRDFYAAALAASAVAKVHDVPLIINDRIDIAIAVEASGVHLGQDDIPPTEARRILGKEAIIGYSTHSMEQVRAASTLPVDYIAFGPVFPTLSKDSPEDAVGLDGLKEAKLAVGGRPLVAIGGIDESSLLSVLAAGADSAAMIGCLLSDPQHITVRMQKLTALLR
jgi:thiamine-phosphate pyrophosphorylase